MSRPSVRVEVAETDTNLEYRWQVVVIDTEVPYDLVNRPGSKYRFVVYAAKTEDEAIEVSHAVAATCSKLHEWWRPI